MGIFQGRLQRVGMVRLIARIVEASDDPGEIEALPVVGVFERRYPRAVKQRRLGFADFFKVSVGVQRLDRPAPCR